jgi:hypothetical protein
LKQSLHKLTWQPIALHQPKKKIAFTNDRQPPQKKFYDFLVDELNIDEVQAIRFFTDFTSQLQNELNKKNIIYFKGIGTLTKQTSNVILFQPDEIPGYFPELPGGKESFVKI